MTSTEVSCNCSYCGTSPHQTSKPIDTQLLLRRIEAWHNTLNGSNLNIELETLSTNARIPPELNNVLVHYARMPPTPATFLQPKTFEDDNVSVFSELLPVYEPQSDPSNTIQPTYSKNEDIMSLEDLLHTSEYSSGSDIDADGSIDSENDESIASSFPVRPTSAPPIIYHCKSNQYATTAILDYLSTLPALHRAYALEHACTLFPDTSFEHDINSDGWIQTQQVGRITTDNLDYFNRDPDYDFSQWETVDWNLHLLVEPSEEHYDGSQDAPGWDDPTSEDIYEDPPKPSSMEAEPAKPSLVSLEDESKSDTEIFVILQRFSPQPPIPMHPARFAYPEFESIETLRREIQSPPTLAPKFAQYAQDIIQHLKDNIEGALQHIQKDGMRITMPGVSSSLTTRYFDAFPNSHLLAYRLDLNEDQSLTSFDDDYRIFLHEQASNEWTYNPAYYYGFQDHYDNNRVSIHRIPSNFDQRRVVKIGKVGWKFLIDVIAMYRREAPYPEGIPIPNCFLTER